jgi:hypothetical protein
LETIALFEAIDKATPRAVKTIHLNCASWEAIHRKREQAILGELSIPVVEKPFKMASVEQVLAEVVSMSDRGPGTT